MRTNKIKTARFGLYVGIDLWEVCTTSIVSMNITNLYSIYIGHHKTSFTYNVALPSSAFSESNCLFVNVLGMVQRTVRAVKASVNDKDMLHSPDVLLCSLSNYLLNNVKFPICHSTNNAFVSNAVAVQLLRSYFPYSVGSVSDADVCRRLISKTYCRMPGIVYIMRVRCNYMTDVVSRVAICSMQRRSYCCMCRHALDEHTKNNNCTNSTKHNSLLAFQCTWCRITAVIDKRISDRLGPCVIIPEPDNLKWLLFGPLLDGDFFMISVVYGALRWYGVSSRGEEPTPLYLG